MAAAQRKITGRSVVEFAAAAGQLGSDDPTSVMVAVRKENLDLPCSMVALKDVMGRWARIPVARHANTCIRTSVGLERDLSFCVRRCKASHTTVRASVQSIRDNLPCNAFLLLRGRKGSKRQDGSFCRLGTLLFARAHTFAGSKDGRQSLAMRLSKPLGEIELLNQAHDKNADDSPLCPPLHLSISCSSTSSRHTCPPSTPFEPSSAPAHRQDLWKQGDAYFDAGVGRGWQDE